MDDCDICCEATPHHKFAKLSCGCNRVCHECVKQWLHNSLPQPPQNTNDFARKTTQTLMLAAREHFQFTCPCCRDTINSSDILKKRNTTKFHASLRLQVMQVLVIKSLARLAIVVDPNLAKPAARGLFQQIQDGWWVNIHCKSCPTCGVFIEKNMGCNYIGCSNCLQAFCWRCVQRRDPFENNEVHERSCQPALNPNNVMLIKIQMEIERCAKIISSYFNSMTTWVQSTSCIAVLFEALVIIPFVVYLLPSWCCWFLMFFTAWNQGPHVQFWRDNSRSGRNVSQEIEILRCVVSSLTGVIGVMLGATVWYLWSPHRTNLCSIAFVLTFRVMVHGWSKVVQQFANHQLQSNLSSRRRFAAFVSNLREEKHESRQHQEHNLPFWTWYTLTMVMYLPTHWFLTMFKSVQYIFQATRGVVLPLATVPLFFSCCLGICEWVPERMPEWLTMVLEPALLVSWLTLVSYFVTVNVSFVCRILIVSYRCRSQILKTVHLWRQA